MVMAMKYLFFFTLLVLCSSAFSNVDQRLLIIGHWQCTSQIKTDYGQTQINGQISLLANETLVGTGELSLQHPSFNLAIPMSVNLKARWLLFKNQLVVSDATGEIKSHSPLFNQFAQILQQELGPIPFTALRIETVTHTNLTLIGQYQTNISCTRPNKDAP